MLVKSTSVVPSALDYCDLDLLYTSVVYLGFLNEKLNLIYIYITNLKGKRKIKFDEHSNFNHVLTFEERSEFSVGIIRNLVFVPSLLFIFDEGKRIRGPRIGIYNQGFVIHL